MIVELQLNLYRSGPAHLTQGALQLSQEVVVFQVVGVVVDVIHAELQLLQCLKEVVHFKLLGEPWIKAVQNHLCPPKL